MSKRLLLVGAGHAHLEVLKQLAEHGLSDVDVCLITPSPYQYYSGMFSGFTEGIYTEEDTRVDLRPLAQRAGVQLIQKTAVMIRPEQKKVICHDGSVYPFDAASFDIGSRSLPGSVEHSAAQSIKPNYHFTERMKDLRETPQPLIVGGGAAGTELALSIQSYKHMHQRPGQVRLVTSGSLLSDTPKWVRARMKHILKKKGVRVWENEEVKHVADDSIETSRGNKIRHTGVLWLGGAVGDSIFIRAGLDVDDRGFAFVSRTLQFKNYDYLFGAGDCITLETDPDLPKSGVYAVRQGPVLWENLKNHFQRRPLEAFVPQKKALYILSTGDRKGFLIYGAVHAHNHKAWKLKHKIDREFMAKYK